MKIVKIIFTLIGIILLVKAVNEEDFDGLFLAMFILAIGTGLEEV